MSCLAVVLIGLLLFASGIWAASKNKKEYEKLERECKGVDSLRSKIISDVELAQLEDDTELAVKDKKTVSKLAEQTTLRDLLYSEVFPRPRGEMIKNYYLEFGQLYCEFIDKLLSNLHAGDRPSDVDEEKVSKEYQESTKTSDGEGSRTTLGMSTGSQLDNLLDNFRRERANQISIYANSNSFCCYDYWNSRQVEDKETMMQNSWYSQLAAWIQEDVALSIMQANKDSQSVPNSAVKRLIEVSFNGTTVKFDSSNTGRTAYGGQSAVSRRNPETALPAYVMESKQSSGASTAAAETYTGQMAVPWTGHACNDHIDVVHFEVAVVIDSTRIDEFTFALQDKKFSSDSGSSEINNLRNQITVLEMHMERIDVELEKNSGYYYGSGSNCILRLICEYTFFKKGYEHLMPEPVKNLFKDKSDNKLGKYN
jgi:hypothetical protein